MCPSHVTEKWVREIEETVPNSFAGIIRNISELRLFYAAYEKGLNIAMNPAPMDARVKAYPLDKVSVLMLNETEGRDLSGETDPDRSLDVLSGEYPRATILLTLGKDGSLCQHDGKRYRQDIYSVKAVDTTAAGDTFCGYFLKAFFTEHDVIRALDIAAKAASICVSRVGAAQSIPSAHEVC